MSPFISRLITAVVITGTVSPAAAVVDRGLAPAHASSAARNGKIVFTVNQATQTTTNTGIEDLVGGDVFTVSPAGGDVRQITRTPDAGELEPEWSPDGRRILFSRFAPSGNPGAASDLYVMDPGEPDAAVNITQSPLWNEEGPALAPDGSTIAFARDDAPSAIRPPQADIYLMTPSGGDIVQLTEDPADEYNPEWSPDGGTIAFVHGFGVIRLMRSDGSRAFDLAAGTDPSWSPDGRRIAYQNAGDIFVIDRDRSNIRNLTITHRNGDADDQDPAWSPDGRWIAFVSNRDGGYKLYKMRSDGSRPTKIVDITIGAGRSGIDWGPRP